MTRHRPGTGHCKVGDQLADGGFLICRWNMTRDVPDLDALARFLFTMGVRND